MAQPPQTRTGRETLLSASSIWLFGRVVEDLEIRQADHDPFIEPRDSCNNFLANQLGCHDSDPARAPRLARIYAFSYEGTYYELEWPALFLVHGPGAAAEAGAGGAGTSAVPGDPSRTGLSQTDFEFAANLRVWSYDRADLSIRLDVDSGSFEQILLDVIFGGGGGGSMSGARVSGARVAGARVAGARVAGARVAGARVAGARARGGRDDGGD